MLRLLRQQSVLLILLAVIVLGRILSEVFLTSDNIVNVIRWAAVGGLVAVGQTLVLIARSFDLSQGAIVSLGGLVYLAMQPSGPTAALVAGVAAGAMVGAVNGFFVARVKANALIITMGMSSVLFGGMLLYTKASPLLGTDPRFTWLGTASLAGIPVSVIFLLVVAAASQFALGRTTTGRILYAIGHSDEACTFAGIPVDRYRWLTFVSSGTFAALGGIVLASQLNTAQSTLGTGAEFDALTAAILGGASLVGGEGSVLRTLAGVLVMALLANLMILLGVPYNGQLLIKGLVFLVVVVADLLSKRWLS